MARPPRCEAGRLAEGKEIVSTLPEEAIAEETAEMLAMDSSSARAFIRPSNALYENHLTLGGKRTYM